MSWQVIRGLSVPVVAALALIVSQGSASAVNLVFNSAANTQPPFHNPGAPPVDVNKFSVDVSLTNGSSLFVQGNVHFDIDVSANLGLTGATFSQGADVNIPAQNIAISANKATVNSTPTGSASLTLWDEQTGGFDPGGDGSNPNPGAKLPSTLANADLTGLNVSFINGPGASLTTNQIQINGNGQLNNVLGLFDIPLDVTINGQANASLNSLGFTQTSGDAILGSGIPGSLVPGANASNTYTLFNNGLLNGGGNVSVGGDVNISILGGLINPSFNLGNLINESVNLSSGFPLVGVTTLADLNPGGYDTVNHDDLQTTIALNIAGGAIPFALSSTGSAILSTVTTLTTNLVAPVTITARVSGTVTFGILASLEAGNFAYQLQDSIAGVVAPEPGSVVLMLVGLAAAMPLLVRRFRRNR